MSLASERQIGTGAGIAAIGVGAYVAWRIQRKKDARALQEANERSRSEYEQQLVDRYGADNARRILAKEIWQGATAEMVVEMFGAPAEKARRVFKTKTTETWKYDPLAKNRFRLKVTLENDVCVGWETA